MFCAPLVGEFNLFVKLHIYTIAQRYKFFWNMRAGQAFFLKSGVVRIKRASGAFGR